MKTTTQTTLKNTLLPITDTDTLALLGAATERLEAPAAAELARNLTVAYRELSRAAEPSYTLLRDTAARLIAHRQEHFGLVVHHVHPTVLAHELARAWA